MKKILVILAVMLLVNQNMFGQDRERKFTVQTNPLLWFSDVFANHDDRDIDDDDMLFAMDVEGQYKINNSINISLSLSFLIDNHTVIDDEDTDYYYKENVYQINLKPMFILRPFNTGLSGFYIGFYPNIGLLHVDNENKSRFYTEFGFGINCGYKWVFKNGFTMQLGSGIGKTFSSPGGSRQYLTINSDGRLPLQYTDILLLEFKLGYSF